MVGKRSKGALAAEGLERTDNGMKQSSWPEATPINQKNYYTDYMKREDQILPLRLQSEASRDRMIKKAKDKDRALAQSGSNEVQLPTNGEAFNEEGDEPDDSGIDPSKIIIIHPGSQNLRIGFASDALPKTIPMVIASQASLNEAKLYGPLPKKEEDYATPEQQFGDEFSKKFTKMSNELKVEMRQNKRKVLPNSKELVVNYNKRTSAEEIPEHNDPIRIEWTDVSGDEKSDSISHTGMAALRIPEDSKPIYQIRSPMQLGWFNEKDYPSRALMIDDFEYLLEQALKKDLGLSPAEWDEYSCVFVIPDLYDKKYVEEILDMLLTMVEFKQVCFIQESMAGSFGAGYGSACIVDVGAQKISIGCVEDGFVIEDSRVNLKYGGWDVTETFIKMMLHDHFPYEDINLRRRYDFLLAEELKINFCTMSQADISVQLYNFHVRAPNQSTRKYQFKTYDEVILAPSGYFDPAIFDHSEKLVGRRKLIDRSYNAYDVDTPDDPTSSAQLAILTSIKPDIVSTATGFSVANGNSFNGNGEFSTPSKEKSNPFNKLSRMDTETNGNSRVTSAAASPAPEGTSTPAHPTGALNFSANSGYRGSPAPPPFAPYVFGNESHNSGTPNPPGGGFVDERARTQRDIAAEQDAVLPIAPLDAAILTSILHAGKGDMNKVRQFCGSIMVIGGGAKTHGFGPALEEKLKARRPDLSDKILVGVSPREMDGQVVVWKGASILGKLDTNDSWIVKEEYERLNSRILYSKVLWHY